MKTVKELGDGFNTGKTTYKTHLADLNELIIAEFTTLKKLGDGKFKQKVQGGGIEAFKALKKFPTEVEDEKKKKEQLKQFRHDLLNKLKALRKEYYDLETPDASNIEVKRSIGIGGNCLFDSVSEMLNRGTTAAELRAQTAQAIYRNPLDFVDYLIEEHDDIMQGMLGAATYIAEDGNWSEAAGELAPLAIASTPALQGRQLIILNMDGSVKVKIGTGQPLFIFYNGWNHYMPAKEKD